MILQILSFLAALAGANEPEWVPLIEVVDQTLVMLSAPKQQAEASCSRTQGGFYFQSLDAYTRAQEGEAPLRKILNWEEALSVFKKIREDRSIAHDYVDEYCGPRAHLICKRLEELGIFSRKSYVLATIDFPDSRAADGRAYWGYHVAPVVKIRTASGEEKDMIFDTTLFNEPVTVEQWRNKMGVINCVNYPNEGEKKDCEVYETNRQTYIWLPRYPKINLPWRDSWNSEDLADAASKNALSLEQLANRGVIHETGKIREIKDEGTKKKQVEFGLLNGRYFLASDGVKLQKTLSKARKEDLQSEITIDPKTRKITDFRVIQSKE